MRWLRGFVQTCLGGLGAFIVYHFLRFYIGLWWTVVVGASAAVLLFAARIVWVAWIEWKARASHGDHAN